MQNDGSQCLWGGLVALLMVCCQSSMALAGAYVASTANFTVLAPTQALADEVASRAEGFRREIALEWLEGESLPSSRQTTILVRPDSSRSIARTIIGTEGIAHRMWIISREDELTGTLLRHEVAHTVMAARFGATMPAWANEGIASRYDNASRRRIRQQKLVEFAALESWPNLEQLFASPVRSQWAYATSVSLTDFLVARGGKPRFMQFVDLAITDSWDVALRECYGIGSIEHLEAQWRASVRREAGITSPRVARTR